MTLSLRSTASLLCLLASACLANAITYHIHAERGDNSNSGSEDAPLKTLAAAIAKAQPGDTLALLPHEGPIHDTAVIQDRSGTAEEPIILEGNGQTLSGLKALNPEDWEALPDGLYRSRKLPTLLQNLKEPLSSLRRFFFVFDGQIVQQGRGSKRAFGGWPTPEALKPLQWTWNDSESALYLRLPSGTTLEAAKIAYPELANGVATRGKVAHWEVRNLTVRGFLNDGYNFHGDTQHFRLKEIAAYQCGDDGMSAHSACAVEVDGFTAKENSTGICHINESVSSNDRVTLEQNRSFNLYLLGTGRHEFRKSSVSALDGGIRLGTRNATGLTVAFTDCEFPGEGEAGAEYQVEPGVELTR